MRHCLFSCKKNNRYDLRVDGPETTAKQAPGHPVSPDDVFPVQALRRTTAIYPISSPPGQGN